MSDRDLLAAARVGRLATASAAGEPHVVPLCFALDGDTLYFAVDQKPKRTRELRRLANLRENPRVSVLVDEWDEDWSRLWWVRADGRARVVADGGETRRALELLAAKYPQYRDDPPGGPVVAVELERVSSWRSR